MLSPLRLIIIVLLCFVSLACRSSQEGQTAQGAAERDNPQIQLGALGESIPPNHCRVLATVVAIDTAYRLANPSEPCGKAPCQASVRVDSILGYGQAFTRPLVKGETLPVSFAFTVAPTRDLFPQMTQSYPGVHIGTILVTDVLATQEIANAGSQQISFSIFGYTTQ